MEGRYAFIVFLSRCSLGFLCFGKTYQINNNAVLI